MDKNEEENLDNISKRLKYLVESLGVKQSHMAEKLGLSPSGLHYILNNDVKFSKNTKKIAEYLNVNEDWLLKGEGAIYDEARSIKVYDIPIYYPDQLKLYYYSNKKEPLNTRDFMLTSTIYRNKIIAVHIIDQQFSPKFEIHDHVAFEEASHFRENEILLVYLAQTNNVVIKHGVNLSGDIILSSNNTSPIKLQSKAGDVIIGAYRECHKKVAEI
ncbi:MAG: helix-turn-helix transcriptional regulator [Legionellales bacterium]|nr:helix-turn-helix transcriptional regulator [Legionellales bacterium]